MMLKSVAPKIKEIVFLCLLLMGIFGYAAETYVFQPAVSMYGSPKYAAGFKAFDYVNVHAPKTGTFRQSAFGSFDTFNPFSVNGIPPAGIGLLFDTLMKSSADEPFSLYGLIADGIFVLPEKKGVAFHINPQARFQDGSPILAEDVIFSFETLKEKGVPTYRYYYQDVESVTAPDSQTVVFHFRADSQNRELPFILGELPIFPKKNWQSKDFDKTDLTVPIGSGPYLIDSFQPGRQIVYRRNPDYWARDLNVNRGFYNFEKISYEYFRDTTVAMEAFKSGLFDVRQENEAKKWMQFQKEADKFPHIKAVSFTHRLPSGMQGFVFNLRRKIFQNIFVREALIGVFDFRWMNQNLFYGLYHRTESFFDNSDLKAPLIPTDAEKKFWQKLGVAEQDIPDIRKNPFAHARTVRQKLRTALNLLNAGGWYVQNGVLKNKHGQPFTFEILLESGSSGVWERVVLPYIGLLKRLGIQARVRTVDTIQYKNRLDNFDYDMIVSVWGQSLSPGNEQRYFWGKQAALTEGSMNYSGIQNNLIDSVIEALIQAQSREELTAGVQALDRILLSRKIVVPHWYASELRFLIQDQIRFPQKTLLKGPDLSTWWKE